MFLTRQSIKVLKELMRAGEITQSELSKRTGVSIGQVNKLVTKLKYSALATMHPKRGVKLVDRNRLLLTIGADSPMRSDFKALLRVPFSPSEARKKIAGVLAPNSFAFTLLSAAPAYSAYVQGETVSLYLDKNNLSEGLARLKRLESANGIPVEVFQANDGVLSDATTKGGERYVSNEQLLIDLFRTPQLVYVGAKLLDEYQKARTHG